MVSSGKNRHIYTFPAISLKEHSMLSHSKNSTLFFVSVSDWGGGGYSVGVVSALLQTVSFFAQAESFICWGFEIPSSVQSSGGKWKRSCGAHGIERWRSTCQQCPSCNGYTVLTFHLGLFSRGSGSSQSHNNPKAYFMLEYRRAAKRFSKLFWFSVTTLIRIITAVQLWVSN